MLFCSCFISVGEWCVGSAGSGGYWAHSRPQPYAPCLQGKISCSSPAMRFGYAGLTTQMADGAKGLQLYNDNLCNAFPAG